MSSLTILTDSDVQKILHGITTAEAHTLATALEDAFITYSCRGDAQYQPHRSVVTRESTGATSIFMPATTPRSIGVKIVGVSGGSKSASETAETTESGDGQGEAPAPVEAGLKSILTLCDAASGRPVGVLNAAELTGFRTALGSMLLYRLRRDTAKVVVFGAGKQAEWHIRLAVLLRGADIREVAIVNRNGDRTRQLIQKMKASSGSGGVGGSWPAHITLEAFSEDSSTGSGGEGGLEKLVADADVLFFTTPSKTPLFPASFLLSEQARRKTRYISAIGSYTLDMGEIDPDLVTAVGQSPLASQGWQGGHIVVDSREACLQEAGEFVKSGLSPDKWLDVGYVTEMLRREQGPQEQEEGLREWLESGFVIYKSVGVGIMDIAIGDQLLELARRKNLGTSIEDF